uniref:SGNH/GDSL hydrolase family protein n=1 Tax=uncultured Erythrobacter sp. TaxID=263913 RepID=UPI00261DFF6E|nr:GDSL-type esterase/lipase family protein [uncultured Erythrobacter sp.]
MVKWIKAALVLFVVSFVILALGSGEIPAWRSDGTRTVEVSSVSANLEILECPNAGSQIAIYGDSHVSGARMDGSSDESRSSFSAVFADTLPDGVVVAKHGVGGHTAAMGESRWLVEDASDQADLVLLFFGTNDAAPRGWLRDKQPVPLEEFAASMGRLIDHFERTGSRVILIAPPPAGSRAIAGRLGPYRQSVASIGAERGLSVLDPADAFSQCEADQPLLVRDALHMREVGHRCLGEWMARTMCPNANAN